MSVTEHVRALILWWRAMEVLLQRSRGWLGLGSLAALLVGWAILGGIAAGLPCSMAERLALVAMPVAWAGLFGAAVLLGSPRVHWHRILAATVLGCSGVVMALAVPVLRAIG
ncbi:MAG: hypothetical protein U0840_02680 [Gemmataceae bacterium]